MGLPVDNPSDDSEPESLLCESSGDDEDSGRGGPERSHERSERGDNLDGSDPILA